MMNKNSTNAIENSACLCSPAEYDISLATAVVKKRTLWNNDGIFGTFPETIITAIASPIARPTPNTTAAAIPLLAAGTDTLKYVSISVAPSASYASSYSFGTASSALSETLIIDGKIMIASTIIAARRLAPSGTLNNLRIPGTRISIPTRP